MLNKFESFISFNKNFTHMRNIKNTDGISDCFMLCYY